MSGMIVLYFTACLARSPDTCTGRSLSLDVETPRACQRLAQPQLALWVEAHPDYRITGYRCGAPLRDPGTRI